MYNYVAFGIIATLIAIVSVSWKTCSIKCSIDIRLVLKTISKIRFQAFLKMVLVNS